MNVFDVFSPLRPLRSPGGVTLYDVLAILSVPGTVGAFFSGNL